MEPIELELLPNYIQLDDSDGIGQINSEVNDYIDDYGKNNRIQEYLKRKLAFKNIKSLEKCMVSFYIT